MEFELTDEQAMLRDSVRRWTEKHYSFEKRQEIIRTTDAFSKDRWAEMAELGWLMVALPEAAGGLGCSTIETALIAEEFGRALVIEPYTFVAVLAARVLEFIETDSSPLLEEIGTGARLVVLAHNEHEARGDVHYVATKATRTGEGWRLGGRKTAILAGPGADVLIVSARVSGEDGDPAGIALFQVDPGAEGVSRQAYRMLDGSAACDVVLENAVVGEAALIGRAGEAGAALASAHAHAVTSLCAEAVGVMDRALWITCDYMRTRQQFGVPISTFQSLQHRAADMYIAVEQARAMLNYGLAHLEAKPASRDFAVSEMKAQVGQLGHYVCGQAIQLHGGIGVTEEYAIGHYFKRMTVIESIFGHSQTHLLAVADGLRHGNS